MKIVSIVGARPQFIKMAPFVRALKELPQADCPVKLDHTIIHTGQHYDYKMDKIFFDQLGIPDPDINLNVGSGSHGWQLGEMLKRIEKVLKDINPDMVIVYGDTNSTLAGSLMASRLHIFVAHVEAGLRSFNKAMPEEINRILADHCSDLLFVPTVNAAHNLNKEGVSRVFPDEHLFDIHKKLPEIDPDGIPVVINIGDIMYDIVLLAFRIAEKKSSVLEDLKLQPNGYYLVTMHRAENTGDPVRFRSILEALIEIGKKHPVVFPMHPRTQKVFKETADLPDHLDVLRIIEPVSYFDMLILQKNARKILTDSGGIQKEAFFLKVPCVTLRDETEWIETLEKGYNILAGANREKIIEMALQESSFDSLSFSEPYFGDGHAAERMTNVLLKASSLFL